ncbi:DNA/RNA non-specific endonuclease [Ruegeria lacuscaerulensis]|uniref:DNA/RNA non-specific endonuclease n=1 Tax=Ruegeria lacuscaerulensis TaxID=55218 RepID=UPI00147F8456|nr:DNA/RNA non-specific endonuclease [Ruegeria lacuscaerulensis]
MYSPEKYALERISQSKADIHNSLIMAQLGNPFAAEPNAERRRGRVQAKANLTATEANAFDREVMRRSEAGAMASEADFSGAEAVWGDTIDFVNVAFLAKGARVARSVARVTNSRNGRGRGSGVLIGGNLFITNQHVIASIGQANQHILEFDFERDEQGARRAETRYAIDPSVFVSDPVQGLDFAIFAVGNRISGPAVLADFGSSPLSDASDKHMLGEFANIVQHPQGRLKEVVLRENRLVSRFDDFLHYVADTEKGSSGSPVYNSEWQMIALHHWGSPKGATADPTIPGSGDVNEGIRISSIVRYLMRNMSTFPTETQNRIGAVLQAQQESLVTRGPSPLSQSGAGAAPQVRLDADGRATWTVPLEISVQLPAVGPSAAPAPQIEQSLATPAIESSTANAKDRYADRKGYQPHFLPGFEIPLPSLGNEIKADAAPLLDPGPGENPHELKYHHYSVIMNAQRRLAFVSACMIDGKSSKSIGRSSRKVTDLSPNSPGLAEAMSSLEDAEADSWSIDPRINRLHQSGDELYRKQVIPGFPNPQSAGRIARMFQKGHLVRRLDPAWGDEDRALEAEIDTFHWTNAAPQVGFFNQGTADEDMPGTGKGNLWRAAENYVLRNAVAEDQKVVSFTGPIFAADDRKFRHTKVPGRFFKVTAWVENGQLRSLALIVDQMQVIEVWPDALDAEAWPDDLDAAEAFQATDEMERVTDFLSTIEEVERLTHLDFGTSVRDADIRKGELNHLVTSDEELPFTGEGSGAVYDTGDDLTQINGIGPATMRDLNRFGIFSLRQIAAWTSEQAEDISEKIGLPRRAERDDWVGQASQILNLME